MFPNKLTAKVPSNIPENPPLCSLVSFLIVLIIPFNKILESSIYKISFISSFEITKVVVPEPCTFF